MAMGSSHVDPNSSWIAPSTTGSRSSFSLPTVGAAPKIRLIGLAESLLKISEGAKLGPIMADVCGHLEPSQLGVGTPDGVVLVVSLLRWWADSICDSERSDDISEDPSAIVPIDLHNTCGMFLRPHALQAALEWHTLQAACCVISSSRVGAEARI